MPFVRISLHASKSAIYRRAIADGIHQAMIETLGVPAKDRFQVVTEHDADGLIYDPSYLGIERTDDVVFVQVTLSGGRKPKQKRDFYARAASCWRNGRASSRRNCSSTSSKWLGRTGRSGTARRSTPSELGTNPARRLLVESGLILGGPVR